MEQDWVFSLGLVATASLVALAALFLLAAFNSRVAAAPVSIFSTDTPSTVLLFDGSQLVDATPEGRALISGAERDGGPWLAALTRLDALFPGLGARIEGLNREGRFILCSREDVEPPMVLRAELVGGLTRLTLIDSDDASRRSGREAATDITLREELSTLRETLGHAPMPIWRETPEGAVVWANGSYLQAVVARLEPGQELGWPLPRILEPEAGKPGNLQCRSVLRVGEEEHWFEVVTLPDGNDMLCYAMPADRLMQAEGNLRDFMQTLTKTFAQLPIGLAIFDRSRVLQLFNPALIDLTGLTPEFLIGRPTLSMLLDAMRESSMLPEPRDYQSWRRQLVEMELAAASGLFVDTWTLPSGQTYRVTGRPHPNGALAFLVEDISTEMMRTRRYRADLELGQAVIDAMGDAVVVFAQDGGVSMSNTAARGLWGEELNGLSAMRGEAPVFTLWRKRTAPTLLWNDLEQYIGKFGPRDPWEGEVRLNDGRLLACRVAPMPHGATLVAFRYGLAHDAGEEGPAQAVLIA